MSYGAIKMDKPDALLGPPSADALPRYRKPAFDSNTHWYEEYLNMMHRANDIVVAQTKALQYAAALHKALTDVLEETAGGNFLSQHTRDRVQALLRDRFTPSI